MKRLNKLRTGLFSRHMSMAKMAASLGKDYFFSSKDELVEKLGEALSGKVEGLTDELGQLKGSFLKAGQMLSLYAQDLLPPEVENLLTKLQSQSSYLDWEQISKQIPSHILESLKIEEEPFAAASIGQVHKAKDSEGHYYALKIQYKNIEKVIDMDLRFLKLLVNVTKVIPKGVKLDKIFEEIRQMLLQEMDYQKEVALMERYRGLAGENYLIPKVYPQYSSKKVICADFIQGQTIEEAVLSLDQEERNQLAKDMFQLFLNEIFHWNLVQSDAHFGNFLIKDKKWVLLDFGATKELDPNFSPIIQEMIRGVVKGDRKLIRAQIEKLDVFNWEKSNLEAFWRYCELLSSPFQTDDFDWGSSDISKRAMNMSRELHQQLEIQHTPHQTIFVDRKIAGIYYIFKKLGAKGNILPEGFL